MRRIVTALFLLAGFALPAAAQTTTSACSAISLGDLGALNGWVPSPNDAWHQDISAAPVDPSSTTIMTTPGDLANRYLHPDFSNVVDGAYGIPYTIIDSTNVPFSQITPYDPFDSDNTLYPITANTPIEGSPGQCWTDGNYDHHAIIIDRTTCADYEIYQADLCSGQWSSYGNVIWDFTLPSGEQRPYGMSSVDAAGLSVFEGLIRYDEIVAGQINHAIRFTAVHTKQDSANGYFTAPATHAAGNLWGTDDIMGMRIRLQANFDISGYSPTNQIILTAMKKYGMILADNGADMFFQGTPDPRWNDDDLSLLKQIPSTAFEVVKMNPVYDAYTAPSGPAPDISSFTASADNVAPGTPVTLTPLVGASSYEFVDLAGFIRGPVTVTPNCTTTYTLYSRNQYDTATASVTVNVVGGLPAGCESNSGSGSNTAPTIVFPAIGAQNYPSAPFAVTATSNSAGAITYAVISGPASISGNVVTLTGAGIVTVEADQAANGTYTAGSQQMTFSSNAGTQPILQFAHIADQVLGVAPFTVSASSASSGAVTYSVMSGPATITGNVVTLTAAGRVTLMASQAASGSYLSATASIAFNVIGGGTVPGLAFNPIANQTLGAAPFAVTATSSSSAPITYSVVSGPASISGNIVTLTGAGTVTLQATQPQYGTYTAATATTYFAVTGLTPTLTINPIANQTFGVAPFPVNASSNSAGAISYSIVTGPASLNGNLLTLTGAGSITVQANVAAADNYTSATATTSFNVTATAPTLTFTPVPDQSYGAAPFSISATTNSAGAITYSVLSGPATNVGRIVTVTGIGTVTLQASEAAAFGYTAATVTTTFNVSGSTPALTFAPVANQAFGAAPFAVSATSASTGAITYSVVSGPASIAGNIVTLTGAGPVTLLASQAAAGGYTAASTNTSFNVAGVAPTLNFSPVANQTAGAAPFVVSVVSNSTGAITYSVANGPATMAGNTVTLTGVGTVTLQASQAAAAGYTAGTATTSFNIAGAGPTLAFTPVPNQTFGAAPFAVSATSNSPGAITYAVVGGPASVSGNTVAITGTGTVTLQASQAASGSYIAAAVSTTFNVAAASASLAFNPIANQSFGASPLAVSASSNSPGAITYSVLAGPAVIAGNIVTLTGAGTVTLQASQAAASGYNAATTTISFNVNATTPNITFNGVPNQAFGAAPFSVTANSNSPVALTYSVISGPATIAGNLVTLTGAGTVTVQASQAASGGYAAASATVSFNVSATNPTVTFSGIANQTFGSAPFAIAATSNSPGAVTYSVISGPATIAGNLVTLTGAGAVTVQASQAAAGGYAAASATASFNVSAIAPTFNLNPVPAQTFGGAPFVASAASNSPGAITYSVLSGPATIAGNALTATGVGVVVIQAVQSASGGYLAATATTAFTVNPAVPNLVIPTISAQTFGNAPMPVSASSNSPAAAVWSVVSGPAVLMGNSISFTAAGPVTLQVTQAAGGNFLSATATTTFAVNPANPNLAIASIPTQTYGSGPLTVSATSNSSAPITYSVLSGPATIAGTSLTLTGAGSVTLQATQPATANYLAASTNLSFTIAPSSVVLAGDFAMPNNVTITMYQGDSKNVAVPVSAINGFNGQVTMYCSVPAAMTFGVCNASNAQLTSTNSTNSTVTVSTRGPALNAQDRRTPLNPATTSMVFLGCLLPCGLPFLRRRKLNLRQLGFTLLLVLSMGAISMTTTGCGTTILDPLTPAGTYVLNVNATSGPTAHAMTITVIVQQPKN